MVVGQREIVVFVTLNRKKRSLKWNVRAPQLKLIVHVVTSTTTFVVLGPFSHARRWNGSDESGCSFTTRTDVNRDGKGSEIIDDDITIKTVIFIWPENNLANIENYKARGYDDRSRPSMLHTDVLDDARRLLVHLRRR